MPVCQSLLECTAVLGDEAGFLDEGTAACQQQSEKFVQNDASVLDSECRMLLLCLSRRLQTDKFGDTDRFRFWQCGIGAFASAVSRGGRVLSIWHLLRLLHHCIMDSWIH